MTQPAPDTHPVAPSEHGADRGGDRAADRDADPGIDPGGIVLVTGAAGFIGSNVARHYAAAGLRVVGCDTLGDGGKWRNLRDIRFHDLITPAALPDWLQRHCGKVALVAHMGAVSATTETNADRILACNVRSTIDLWEWCAAQRARFVYASSAATYGGGEAGFADSDDASYLSRLRPLNAYGWSKHVVDRRVLHDAAAGRPTPPSWAGLKFFNVYGPGEDHKGDMRSVVNKLLPVVRNGHPVKLFRSYRDGIADGEQKRDFVFVRDAVRAVGHLAARPAGGGLYNLGSGHARSWNDLARAVAAALRVDADIAYVDMPPDLRRHYQYFTEADMRKLAATGWTAPATSLESGVSQYAAWWQAEADHQG